MKKPEKLLFFDIDGTLAHHHYVPEENLNALALLKAKGYMPLICTGRPVYYPAMMFGDIPFGSITDNGGAISCENQLLHTCMWPETVVSSVRKLSEETGMGLQINMPEGSTTWNLNQEQMQMVKHMYPAEALLDFDESTDPWNRATSIDFFFTDEASLQTVTKALDDVLILNPHFPHPTADCALVNHGKGGAILWLQQQYQIDKENSWAFGDSFNDLSMFDVCGHRIAMGNGVDELKEKATWITGDYLHGGIVDALVHEGLLTPQEAESCRKSSAKENPKL